MTFSSRSSSPRLYLRLTALGTCFGALLLAAACSSSGHDSEQPGASTDAGDSGSDASRDATAHDAADAAKDASSTTDAADLDAAGDAAMTGTADGGAATVHFNGRMDTRDSAGPRFDWSGSSVTASFTGTGIAVRLGSTDTGNGPPRMQVVIDGTPATDALELDDGSSDSTYTLASNLADGPHTVEVYKRTEGYYGSVQFLGFQAESASDADWALTVSSAPARHLEIIGDSISCGYGVLSPSVYCSGSEYLDYEDAYLAYGLDTARELDATAVSIAWSGKGVYENNDESFTNTIPDYYPLTLATDTLQYDFAQQMDAVVVNLGTNDFTGSAADDKRNPGPPDEDAFEGAFVDLLTTVRGHYPNAYILLIAGPLVNNNSPFAGALDTLKSYLDDIVQTRHQAGDTQIADLEVASQNCGTGQGQEACGCDDHPNVTRQQTMASSIVAALKTAKGW